MQQSKLKKWLIKHAVFAGALGFMLGQHVQSISKAVIEGLVDPLFSVDLDDDGVPDMEAVKQWNVTCMGHVFPIGTVLVQVLKSALVFGLLVCCTNLFLEHTDLLEEPE